MAGAIPAILGSLFRATGCAAARIEGWRIESQRFQHAREESWAHTTPPKIKGNLSSMNTDMNADKLQITTPSDREIAMTRVFNAPRRMVFEALTKPELVKRWLLGPPGWSMPVCEIDLRVGGKYRYVWRRDSDGTDMGMGGVYREIVAPERIVATEKFDQSWYSGDAVGTAS